MEPVQIVDLAFSAVTMSIVYYCFGKASNTVERKDVYNLIYFVGIAICATIMFSVVAPT